MSAPIVEVERRRNPRLVPFAWAAAALPLLGSIALVSTASDRPENSMGALSFLEDKSPTFIAGTAVTALGTFAVAAVLFFLSASIAARKDDFPAYIRSLAIIGALIYGVTSVAVQVLIGQDASNFLEESNLTWQEADDVLESDDIAAISSISLAGRLALGFAFVFVALNAMRVGLLTKFMGYLGIFVGVLVVVPFGSPVPIIQTVWFGGVALLLAGRFPGGTPPAWETGEAIPWPKPEPRQRPARDDDEDDAPRPKPRLDKPSDDEPPRRPREGQKRKRKRR